MILLHAIPVPRARAAKTLDYLWGGFSALAGLGLFFALWHIAARHLDPLILPAPRQVWISAWQLVRELAATDLWYSLYRAALGFAAASAIGIAAGLVAGSFKTLAVLFRPLMTLLLGMPPIIWVVLALFWFGMNDTGIVFTVIMAALPLSFATAMRAMMSVPVPLTEMAASYRLPWPRRITALYLPALAQYLLPSLIVAAGISVKITIMAELLAASSGLGSRLADARAMLDAQTILALVLISVAIIMIIEYLILEPLRRLITPWEN